MQATVFDDAMAGFVRSTRIPVAWAELFWQLVCLFAILWACHGIARQLFTQRRAQWAGVAMVAGLFTLPVSGAAIFLADQHLHPRNAAAALILLAVERILAGRRRQAVPFLIAAFLVHPLMAALGVSFCLFLSLALLESIHARIISWNWSQTGAWRKKAAALVPLGWVLEPASPAWHKALDTRSYYYLYQWTWYEWLGALAPLLLFGLLWRVADKKRHKLLARFALGTFAYGLFQQVLAMVLLGPASWIRLTPFQPMRYLQLVYFFMALIGGCLLGKALLQANLWRWAVYLTAINGGMLAWQLADFPGSAHLELPGRPTANPWLQAFTWIRANTPQDAYFAVDPEYMRAPGEDYHSFRALTERSQLADAVKDASVVTQIPELAPAWERQAEAGANWSRFRLSDFERLKAEFGADWALVSDPPVPGLVCVWHNQVLAVCQIP
jgi:hypothetical protein